MKGKPCSLQTIQKRMITKMSNTTRLVDKLINKGYVKRQQCESNRRKVDITITYEGIKNLNIFNEVVDKAELKLTQNLSDNELYQLNELLNKLRN
jgi:DNA-binding MarR family transcriptional regulator